MLDLRWFAGARVAALAALDLAADAAGATGVATVAAVAAARTRAAAVKVADAAARFTTACTHVNYRADATAAEANRRRLVGTTGALVVIVRMVALGLEPNVIVSNFGLFFSRHSSLHFVLTRKVTEPSCSCYATATDSPDPPGFPRKKMSNPSKGNILASFVSVWRRRAQTNGVFIESARSAHRQTG